MALLAALAPAAADAAVGPDGSSTTATTSETRSATATVSAAGNPDAAVVLAAPQSAANAAVLGALLPTSNSTRTTTSLGFDTSLTFADSLTGPVSIPIGVGPGTANCTGVPTAFGTPTDTGKWPYPECDYTGYQILIVQPGTINVNTNTHFIDAYVLSIDGAALNWLQGSLHAAVPNTLLDDGASFLETLLTHGANSSVAFSTEPMAYQAGPLSTPALQGVASLLDVSAASVDIDAWFAAIPRSSAYADSGANDGFIANGIMFAGGLDLDDGPWRYGVAFSLEGTRVVENNTTDTATIGTVRAGGYASYDVENWTLSGALAAGLHRIDTTRLILLPDPSMASYGAHTLSAGLDATGHYDLGAASLEPMAGIVFTSVATEAFIETGPFGISGLAATTSSLKAYAGGRISTEIADAHGRIWTPDLHGRVSYDLLSDPRTLTATFTGAPTPTPFTVSGIVPSPLAVSLGTALKVEFGTFVATAGYDATLRGNALAHSASLSAGASF